MTDDLVKRLRSKIVSHVDADIWMNDAADRIEELERKLAAKQNFYERAISAESEAKFWREKAGDRAERLRAAIERGVADMTGETDG
jgi:cell division septum initiation protein DivIVA